MKFEEKLMKLRKQNAWSQEELAEKLDVTRQTISKWELGQTTPDTENLNKIATIFGITVNELLDENTNITRDESKKDVNKSRTIKVTILVIILILILIGVGAIALNKMYNKKAEEKDKVSIIQMFKDNSLSDIFNKAFNTINEQSEIINKQTEKINEEAEKIKQEAERIKQDVEKEKNEQGNISKEAFNNTFKTLYYGTIDGFFMTSFIDEVIKSNEENPEHIITVNFDGIETSNVNELRNMKKKFTTGTNYEVYYEYDENGLINKAKIDL